MVSLSYISNNIYSQYLCKNDIKWNKTDFKDWNITDMLFDQHVIKLEINRSFSKDSEYIQTNNLILTANC